MWDDILSEPQYEDRDLYATGVASGHYARGLAYAAKGLIKEAEEEQVRACIDPPHPFVTVACVRIRYGFTPSLVLDAIYMDRKQSMTLIPHGLH